MNKKTLKKIAYFFKSLFSGITGGAIFFLLAMMAFAVAKLFFIIIGRDFIVSRYNLTTVFAIFIIFGFIYGINCFVKRNHFYSFFRITWMNVFIDAIIAGVIGFGAYQFMKNYVKLALGFWDFVLIFALFFAMFYAFSALFVKLYEIITNSRKKTRYRKTAWTLAMVLNPIFILIGLFLFTLVVYNSVYVPCKVIITGIDDNMYTANTELLGIKAGEVLVSLDSKKVSSLQEVKDYINSLDVTKEVQVETSKKVYYVQTYKTPDGERHLGLTLAQQICRKD